jgi:hypothetical protein
VAAVESLITSGRVADLILLLMALETALLTWRWHRGKGAPPLRWLSQIAAGVALVVALRLSLTGAPAIAIGGVLLVAGGIHLAGYPARWR